MARLEFKTTGPESRTVDLKPGINRFGRASDNDVPVQDPTVSATHCEVLLGCGQVTVRDCGSTNGTFLDGTPIREATLLPGQTLRLGSVEILVVDTEIPIGIPAFELPIPAPPMLLPSGSTACRIHRVNAITYRCRHCGELLCDECVHRLRRRGGKLLCLCPLCSFPVEAIGPQKRRKKSLFNRLCETTRLFFNRTSRAA